MKIKNIKLIQFLKLILLIIPLLYYFSNSQFVLAAYTPHSPVIVDEKYGAKITSNGCNTWQKLGTSCKVTITLENTGTVCSIKKTTTTITLTDNATVVYGNVSFGQSTIGSSSTQCSTRIGVKVYNFDNILPVRKNGYVELSKATCTSKKVNNNDSVVCASAPTVTAYFDDGESGVPLSGKITKKCKVGEACAIVGKDNVGNESSPSVTDSSYQRPYVIWVKSDGTKCTAPSKPTIYSGVKYNNYYVGTVKCKIKCTSDNLAVGDWGYGSTTGSKCTAKACDAAGNCVSKSVTVPRDTIAPTCTYKSITQEGSSNGYLLGKVTVTWGASDAQTGVDSATVSKSTNDNSVNKLNTVIKDKAGNSTTCPEKSWSRDNKSPTKCSVTYSDFSNSSVKATAKCASDSEAGCSSSTDSKTYYANGSFSGAEGIRIYDLTQNYGANPKNYLDCTVTINHIDKLNPTCTAKISVANPVLSSDGKTWTTNTWHNASANIYDENGNATANNKNRVQASVNTYKDPESADSAASGIKLPLESESKTVLNEGNKNGIYTVFVRDKVIDTVTNSLRGWSEKTLYAHGLTTTGNVGSCSANVYSFDDTAPVAHVQLMDKQVDGNFSVWSSSNKIQNTTTGKVNNNQNSATFWSSSDITVQYWGTDPQGGYQFTGNTYNGRSGIKRLCYRMSNPNKNNGTSTAWSCTNLTDQRDGSATATGRYKTMTVPVATYPGITTVYVKVQDWAGNWSSEVSQKTYIDIEEPRIGADTSTMKKGFTETTNGQNYNNMKNPIYGSEMLSRPWVNTLVNSVFSGSDNVSNQYAGAYQFGYMWTNEKFTAAQLNASTNWRYYNDTDKTAGIAAGAKNFTLKGITNPNRTDYYYLYVRVCDNVKIGSRNCEIFESQLVRYDNDKPNIDNIIDVTNNEKDEDALSVVDGHGWTNKLKVKVMTHDEPNDGERAQVAYIKFKWNTNPDTKNEDKSKATFDKTENGYTNASSSPSNFVEDGWTYVKCTNEDADANYCAAEIDFNKFVKGTSPVKEGWRFLKVAIVDKAGNVSGNNGIVFGPYRFDLTPPLITGLEFRGHRADNGAEIIYDGNDICEVPPTNSDTYRLGDVNRDWKITQADAELVLSYSTGKETFDSEQKILAEVDNSTGITAGDAKVILDFTKYKIGDVDLDGRLTENDAQLVLSYFVGSGKLNVLQLLLADYNGDRQIMPDDGQAILQAAKCN